ncbi:uncharacterized protein LOC119993814 [Tripterygium wilfordii]|uniref:uncharacterized protein LOC119993814 n=1 Tax=Tripterygium wilfordii TaxID=458696 RepID=UPI0018F8607C|nr:uncharacterized protein LOC119993814 [Tripterygium wilfordii]
MRKGIRNFCNGDCSTSILNQQNNDPPENNPTLEEMILQLELEEEVARKEKLNENRGGVAMRGRMSCVNNSDILRSARNALNQYPRFSLDGKDAMYRSSFRNNFGGAVEKPGRKSVCCDYGIRERLNVFDSKPGRKSCSLGGESVMWCKPGVIAKLMGLEAMPVPISSRNGKETLSCIVKRQNLRRRAERHEMERKLVMNGGERITRSRKGGYCVMKPVAVEAEAEAASVGGAWPTRRFL